MSKNSLQAVKHQKWGTAYPLIHTDNAGHPKSSIWKYVDCSGTLNLAT